MTKLYEGARQLPLRHISIRVPWNDKDWSGCVCNKPADNISCLALPRIRDSRIDDKENQYAGESWEKLDEDKYPPCVSERGGFMASFEFTRKISHPYVEMQSKAHTHLLPVLFRYPAYSAACVPFNWMLKNSAIDKAKSLNLGFQIELENKVHETMGFSTNWVQTKENQLTMLDTFFSAIQPEQSLCFFYAKRIPFIENSGRVLIGVGRVKHVGNYVEYNYKNNGPLKSILWERSIQHSIRPELKDGFLFPYQEIIKYLELNPEEDPLKYVAFAPEEHFDSFSFGSEHVSNDGAIASLLSCLKTIKKIASAVDGPWNGVEKWIDARLNELWKMRGTYPGMGSALNAFGIENGNLLAYEFEKKLPQIDNKDPWILFDNLLKNPDDHSLELKKFARKTICKKWADLNEERVALLKLLSRFELTNEKAVRYYVHEDKSYVAGPDRILDSEIIKNPYLIYEMDRTAVDPVSLNIIDRGLFPDDVLRREYKLPEPSVVEDSTDERRVRAFIINQLEKAAANGHTLMPHSQIIREIRDLEVLPQCSIDGDMMAVVEKHLFPYVKRVEIANNIPAYQLAHLSEMGIKIKQTVEQRIKGKRHEGDIQWEDRLDDILGYSVLPDDKEEQDARREKTEALKELYSSRFSVLIGPAGTGKTTLLKALLQEELIKSGGIIALAPTGKARVRMEQQTGLQGCQTVAQFLLKLDRYDPKTGIYRMSNSEKYKSAKTVVVDEASMLTEEQLAALLDAISSVNRLILVGDPRQLPPIGAGRPFLDIIQRLMPEDIDSKFPKVISGSGYAELTIRRRQQGEARDDLLLSEWFSGRSIDPGADEIWTRISDNKVSKNLKFVKWGTPEELRKLLLDEIVQELNLKDVKDVQGFEQSLGGTPFGNSIYFHLGRKDEPGACQKIENWQILSPVRNTPYGVEAINKLIQDTFRSNTKDSSTQKYRRTPKPMGREQILYGDKVINLKNHQRKDVWPEEGSLQYIANGEIGIVVGQFKGKNSNYNRLPWKLEVEFSSQPDFKYSYTAKDFGEEAEPKLELAYALTIHKVQGSEFGLTFLIIPNPCRLLGRELLYTALTRQKNRVVIFHQGEQHELKKYADGRYSNAAQRLTNIFCIPRPVELDDRFLEESLIHKTRRGESVRSKSEVIIADLLYSRGINYDYEAPFTGIDGARRFPDFSFEDDNTGLRIIWEHLGMMRLPDYQARWEKKLIWYKDQGILPFEEGGGSEGTLSITKDDDRGGIQSNAIEKLLNDVLDM
ncbi:MAG: AAA family ATPase [Desulfamplus sp.]|nr:AAA family ATPase [Desulfamplus sp.]